MITDYLLFGGRLNGCLTGFCFDFRFQTNVLWAKMLSFDHIWALSLGLSMFCYQVCLMGLFSAAATAAEYCCLLRLALSQLCWKLVIQLSGNTGAIRMQKKTDLSATEPILEKAYWGCWKNSHCKIRPPPLQLKWSDCEMWKIFIWDAPKNFSELFWIF